MNESRAKKIRLGYGIFLGAFTVVIGLLFIIGAAQIYYADPAGDPYTYELAGDAFMRILIPVILWIIAIVAGYVLSVLFPYTEKRRGPSARDTVNKLNKRIPQGKGKEFIEERRRLGTYELRFLVWAYAAVFAVVAGAMCIVYLANTANFPAESVNKEIIAMLRGVLPWVGAAFALFLIAMVFDHFSAKREMKSIKKLLVLGKGNPVEAPSMLQVKGEAALAVLGSKKSIWIIRGVILALGILFVVLGILNGGMDDVITKAISICTECIGLG